MADRTPAPADQLRQDIGRLSARHPDGMTTAALAVALAAEGWVKGPLPAETGQGVSEMDETTTKPRGPQRCGSCDGVINLATGECRCSD